VHHALVDPGNGTRSAGSLILAVANISAVTSTQMMGDGLAKAKAAVEAMPAAPAVIQFIASTAESETWPALKGIATALGKLIPVVEEVGFLDLYQGSFTHHSL
jgi:hypothetical protein